jgi:nucleoid-associated protein YgaU
MAHTYLKPGYDYNKSGYRGGQCSAFADNYAFDRALNAYVDPASGEWWGTENGRDTVDQLVKKHGWEYRDSPREGAVFSTTSGTYGHTGIIYQGSLDSNYGGNEIVQRHSFQQGNKWAVNPAWQSADPSPAPTPTPTPAPTPQPTNQWIVKKGDTLWDIAVAVFGDGTRWRDLKGYNGDPKTLPVGTVLTW